jgi:transposase
MAKGYSNNLRAGVISIVMEHERTREVLRLLNVGASTVIRWVERWANAGSVEAKPGTGARAIVARRSSGTNSGCSTLLPRSRI